MDDMVKRLKISSLNCEEGAGNFIPMSFSEDDDGELWEDMFGDTTSTRIDTQYKQK